MKGTWWNITPRARAGTARAWSKKTLFKFMKKGNCWCSFVAGDCKWSLSLWWQRWEVWCSCARISLHISTWQFATKQYTPDWTWKTSPQPDNCLDLPSICHYFKVQLLVRIRVGFCAWTPWTSGSGAFLIGGFPVPYGMFSSILSSTH